MILLEDLLNIHKFSIEKYGGSHSIRDLGLLESAIARPFQSFDGKTYILLFLKKPVL